MKKSMETLLMELKDIFAWSCKDMKGVDLKFYYNKINLKEDAILVKQLSYKMNRNCVKKYKRRN